MSLNLITTHAVPSVCGVSPHPQFPPISSHYCSWGPRPAMTGDPPIATLVNSIAAGKFPVHLVAPALSRSDIEAEWTKPS